MCLKCTSFVLYKWKSQAQTTFLQVKSWNPGVKALTSMSSVSLCQHLPWRVFHEGCLFSYVPLDMSLLTPGRGNWRGKGEDFVLVSPHLSLVQWE